MSNSPPNETPGATTDRRSFLAGGAALAGAGVLGGIGIAGSPSAAGTTVQGDGSVDARNRQLRVMTYNIHFCSAARALERHVNVQRMAHVIGGVDPDVVALQEVDRYWSSRSGVRDQAAELAAALGMFVYFAERYSFKPDFDPEYPDGGDGWSPVPPGAQRREYGRAVLSKYPIIEARNHEIHVTVGRGPGDMWPGAELGDIVLGPGIPEVTLNVKGTRVRVISVHITSGASEEKEQLRRTQVSELVEIAGENPVKTLMLGDLNASIDPETPAYHPEVLPLFDIFADAWQAGTGDGFTFPAGAPNRRIDYVLATPDIEVSRAEVVDTLVSDHKPVVVEVTV